MYVHFALLALLAAGVMLGYRYRLSIALYGLLFAYAHLIDKTNYLNHYYLVVCVCGLMACLPLHARWSLDARRDPALGLARAPAWMLWALRAQFGLVYVFGGIAKLNADWLLHAQPLSLWLGRHAELPVVGGLLALPLTAHVMSWAGALFDLGIVPCLLWRRARPFGYLALVSFHLLTAQLFSIGMFPYFMLCGSLLFLDPDFPERLWVRLEATQPLRSAAARGVPAWPFAAFFVFQLLMPLRHYLYPGDVRWTEQGFRFSWKVMLMEKDGSVDFRVVDPDSGRLFHVSPRQYFTEYQTAMMAPQPDMVLEAARIVADDFRARGVRRPAVYADAFASLNGRSMQRLIDPNVDLAGESDGLSNKSWILPMQAESEMLARSSE
jgi:vitamin K-dependent gamma-carboxylase